MNFNAADREQQIFDSLPESARKARNFVGEALRRRGAPESVVSDFKLVISELVANAIEHSDVSGFTVVADFSDRQWWDVGVVSGNEVIKEKLRSPNTWNVPGYEHTSGRGLGIVKHLMNDVITDISEGRVRIRGRKHRVEN